VTLPPPSWDTFASGPMSKVQGPRSSDRSAGIGSAAGRDPGTGHVALPSADRRISGPDTFADGRDRWDGTRTGERASPSIAPSPRPSPARGEGGKSLGTGRDTLLYRAQTDKYPVRTLSGTDGTGGTGLERTSAAHPPGPLHPPPSSRRMASGAREVRDGTRRFTERRPANIRSGHFLGPNGTDRRDPCRTQTGRWVGGSGHFDSIVS
jgi:hypothetical protein